MTDVARLWDYPKSWDEPWQEPPPPINQEVRAALKVAHERTLAMTPAEKQAMYEAQLQSFIRGMGPCEHGDYDWETCPQCLRQHLQDNSHD